MLARLGQGARRIRPTGAAHAVLLSGPAQARPVRHPKDSWIAHRLPLSRDSSLRDRYKSATGQVRVGKVLELIDALAATSAHAHAGFTKEAAFVTASVDRIDMRNPIELNKDLLVQGCVVWSGRSSMEVRVEVAHEHEGALVPLMLASFTMAARRVQGGGAYTVPLLVPTSDLEQSWNEAVYMKRLQKRALDSPAADPPTAEEQAVVNSLWEELRRHRGDPTRPTNWRFMRDTLIESTRIMHPQRQNTNGKVCRSSASV